MKKTLSLTFASAFFILMVILYLQVKPYRPVATVQADSASFQFSVVDKNNINVTAPSYVVFDIETGEVLLEHNADAVRPIASLTKLITATTIDSQYALDATTTISWADIATEGEAGSLSYGQVYSFRDLLFPLLLQSSNDAAATLERATAGSLVPAMNKFVRQAGVDNTILFDASGLDKRNVSTAKDLATIVRYIQNNNRHILDITELSKYIGPYTGWINNNPVHTLPGYRGGKHGYTLAANRTLIALMDQPFSSSTRTLGYVLLGSADLQSDMKTLKDFISNSVTYN
jgi:D-alanyl-D-alanine carboxypeptidase